MHRRVITCGICDRALKISKFVQKIASPKKPTADGLVINSLEICRFSKRLVLYDFLCYCNALK